MRADASYLLSILQISFENFFGIYDIFLFFYRPPFNANAGQQPLSGPRLPPGMPQMGQPGNNMMFPNRPPMDPRALLPNTRPNLGNILPHLAGLQVRKYFTGWLLVVGQEFKGI